MRKKLKILIVSLLLVSCSGKITPPPTATYIYERPDGTEVELTRDQAKELEKGERKVGAKLVFGVIGIGIIIILDQIHDDE